MADMDGSAIDGLEVSPGGNWDGKAAEAAMRPLVDRLNAAADAYYNGRGELMTDFEWDALFDRVKGIERASGVVLPDSPTNRVGADDVAGRREPHEFAALSLAKTKRVSEVVAWAENLPIWLSWKLDGLTLVATYDGGVLRKVVTRGDGHVGTNITHLAAGIRGLPARVADAGHLVVRGEAVISYADFEAFCAASDEVYANPRNLASGSLSLKDVEELRGRNLRWIPFTLVHADRELASWGARLDYLDSLGFSTVARERIDRPDGPTLQAAIDRWTDRVTGGENPFPVDGLVVCYDDVSYAQTGSVTGHHATRAGFAFKWRDETVETELERVEWSCSVAAITPVAVFRPVSLEGTTVRRASLCNVSECERLGLGDRGTVLSVIKANKIIPKVVGVTRKVGEFSVPAACPVCGAPTALRESASGTRTLACTGAECPARALARYGRFVSKGGMDIDGLAPATLAVFVNRGWIRTMADVYRLGAHVDEIAGLDRFGRKSAENVRASIEAARTRGAVNFLVALSIPACGPEVAKRLLAEYPVRDLFARAFAAARDGEPEAFAAVDGIGPVKSAAFVNWCAADANRALVEDLFREVTVVDPPRIAAGGRCAGLTFAVTGEVHHFANRNALKAHVEAQGGKVASGVSAKTDFLINNDASSTSGKNKKAKELGVTILSEDEFVARFG